MNTMPLETATAARDYDMVRRSLAFLTENWRDQPSLDELAARSGVSPHHLQRLFTRWAGLSPKAFLQAITIDHARELLRDSASILDTAYEVGLSGPGRLHDLFVTHEGMSPGTYKARGRGLTVSYGFHDCPFGRALVMVT
ncbi:MAG: helix-turn-helix transcriptional regulator, partial [Rhizobiales bacterium]|nr:helix-turn-helix transcriptional regulator [Hyphomicrobiales bacterium]